LSYWLHTLDGAEVAKKVQETYDADNSPQGVNSGPYWS
jgi:hypothetical protein